MPKEALIKKDLYSVAFEMIAGKPRPTSKITGKGLVHYAKELGVRPPLLPRRACCPASEVPETSAT